jgi:hypothetical protein
MSDDDLRRWSEFDQGHYRVSAENRKPSPEPHKDKTLTWVMIAIILLLCAIGTKGHWSAKAATQQARTH